MSLQPGLRETQNTAFLILPLQTYLCHISINFYFLDSSHHCDGEKKWFERPRRPISNFCFYFLSPATSPTNVQNSPFCRSIYLPLPMNTSQFIFFLCKECQGEHITATPVTQIEPSFPKLEALVYHITT